MATMQEVVKRMRIEVTESGATSTTEKVRTLAKGEHELNEIQQQRAAAAMRRMQQYEQAQQQMRAEIAIQQQFIAQQAEMSRAANDNAKAWRLSGVELAEYSNHAKAAAVALYALSPAVRAAVNPAITATTAVALKALGPAAVAAASAARGPLGNLLGFVSRIALPVWGIVKAFEAMAAITELGAQKIEEFGRLTQNAAAVGVSEDFFQRHAESARTFKLDADKATDALKKFKSETDDKLGGSPFQQRLDELRKWGNFKGNTGVDEFKNAATTEERHRAFVSLITQAMEKGERLAALDLAAKFLPPEITERLKVNGEYLREMQDAADKVAASKLVPAEEIAYANQLAQRLKDAQETIANGLKPLQKDLTQLGLNYQESIVVWNELLAASVTIASNLYSELKNIPQLFQDAGNAPFWDNLNKWMEQRGLMSRPDGLVLKGEAGFDSDPAMEAARKRLSQMLGDANAVKAAMTELSAVYNKVRKDLSKGPPKPNVDETKTALDRAIDSVNRYIEVTEAAAKAVGYGVYEQQKARTIAELTAAAIRDGKTNLDQYARAWEEMGNRAGAAAQKLAIARAQSRADFDTQSLRMGLSGGELEIAQAMNQLYGDKWQSQMDSALAKQLRMNQQWREAKDIVGDFGNTLVSGLLRGENLMKSLTDAASSLIQKLATQNLNRFLNGGSFFGGQSLGSAAGVVGMASAGLSGYQSSNPLTGAMGGAMAGASFGPWGMAIGGLLGAAGGFLGQTDQLNKARNEWHKAGPAFQQFLTELTSQTIGPIGSPFAPAKEAANDNEDQEDDSDQHHRAA